MKENTVFVLSSKKKLFHKFQITFSTLLFIFLCGCSSPLVITDIQKKYPKSTSAEEVKVYEPDEEIKDSCEILGTISIRDRGNSIHCKYDEILKLGREKSAEVGGNALAVVNHKKPSLWGSSCHQIDGIILHNGAGKHYSIEERNEVAATIDAMEYNKKQSRKSYKLKENTITINGGYAENDSKVYDSYGKEMGSMSGAHFQLHYQHIFSNYAGVGALMDYAEGSNYYISYTHSYFAPEFVFPLIIGKRWAWTSNLGLGLSNVELIVDKYRRLGFHFQTNVSYRFSKHFGVAANILQVYTKMPNKLKVDNKISAFSRSSYSIGLQYHF